MKKTISMPHNMKELLTIEGASKSTITLVEDYYNEVLNDAVQEVIEQETHQQQQEKKEEVLSVADFARRSRKVKR